ncbi:MAG TPA: cupin-like domain-containing protein [archaeon]|nr:cupin-like domain-containing protein [archaeon]
MQKESFGKRRSVFHAVLMQIAIRVKYLFLSWFLLKPFLFKNISKYAPRNNAYKDPPITYFQSLMYKVVIVLVCFTRESGLAAKIAYATGLMRLLHKVQEHLEKKILENCRKNIPKNQRIPLPEYDWKKGNAEDFFENWVKNPHPVVLRGFLDNFIDTKEWTFDSLLKKYGEETVFLTKPEVDGYLGKLKEVNSPGVYLHNSESLFRKYPELAEKLNFGFIEKYMKKKAGFAQIFVGRKKTGAPMHCANLWNFFYMLDGKKKWYFVDPNYTFFAYPYFIFGIASGFTYCRYPNDYDKNVYPLFEYCPTYEVTLQKGDLLLNPPWWWHAVENVTEKSVGVASRWFGDGVFGKDLMMNEENYEINRIFSLTSQKGPASYSYVHANLINLNPLYKKEGVTFGEKRSRYIAFQRVASKEPILGFRHKL